MRDTRTDRSDQGYLGPIKICKLCLHQCSHTWLRNLHFYDNDDDDDGVCGNFMMLALLLLLNMMMTLTVSGEAGDLKIW